MICNLCKMGTFGLHPEWKFWFKCLTCGYCKLIPTDRLCLEDRKLVKLNKYARHHFPPYRGKA